VALRLSRKCNGHLPSEKSDSVLVLRKEVLKIGETPGDLFLSKKISLQFLLPRHAQKHVTGEENSSRGKKPDISSSNT